MNVVLLIAQSHAQMTMYMVRDGNSNTQCDQCMRHGERINVADPGEARGQKPASGESHRNQYRIGPVRQSEQQSIDSNRPPWLQDPNHLQEEKGLRNELLDHGPGGVSRDMNGSCGWPKKSVQGFGPPSGEDDRSGEHCGRDRNPPSAANSANSDAEIAQVQAPPRQIGDQASRNQCCRRERPSSAPRRRAPERTFKTSIHQSYARPRNGVDVV